VINSQQLFERNIDGLFVPCHIFDSAKKMHSDEAYFESNKILEKAVDFAGENIDGRTTPLREAICLYGWNLVLSREFFEFSKWVNSISQYNEGITATSDFQLIFLWRDAMIGDYQHVLDRCVEYLEDNTLIVDRQLAGFLFVKSYVEFPLGLIKDSIDDCESAFVLQRLMDIPIECGRSANFLGMLYRANSNYFDSIKWLERAIEYCSGAKLLRKQSMIYLNLGTTYYKTGNYREAFSNLHKSLQIGLDGGWVHRQCFANIALGNVYRLTRDNETARKHLHAAYGQAQELGFRREESLSLEFLGDVFRDEGRPDEAKRFYKRALSIAEEIAPEGDIVMEIQRRLGECAMMEDDPGGASEHLTAALHMARAQGDRFEEGVTLRVMAETNLALGDLSGAVKTVTLSADLLNEIGAKHELAISLLKRGELLLMQLDAPARGGDLPGRALVLDKAWEDATRALDLMLGINVAWWTEKARNLADRISRRKKDLDRELQASHAITGRPSHDLIIHTSGVMRDLIQMCDLCAGGTDPVLIVGETGTGKELIARRVHERSGRHKKPLVAVNVAAIAPSMFEREFFGHTKGSFSGADRDGAGFAASADGGTLFLDEIGELPREMQPKLLRLIQDGTYQALGDPRPRHSDLRLVAATNADLKDMVDRGEFRADLYFRLKVLELHVPPVRERRDDILPLLRHFLSLAAGRPVEPIEYFNGASLDRLLDHDWPGNVREIAMIARRAVVEMKARGGVHLNLAEEFPGGPLITGPDHRVRSPLGGPESGRRVKAERARILMALEECGGNRIAAARKLGVGRSTLYRRMEKLGIPTRKDSD